MLKMEKIGKLIKKIEKIENLNEIIFLVYLFSFIAFLPISKFLGEVYRICFVTNLFIIFVISLLKNKKIFFKKDIILLGIMLGIFLLDFFFRKNEYTIGVYYDFIKRCYVPCYFFNRVHNIRNLMKYLSLFSKIVMIVYIFDPLLNYYFSGTYMGYGATIMLPSFIGIYVYYLLEREKKDIVFLIFGFWAMFIYGNRACLLSIIFMFALTSRILLKDLKKTTEKIKKDSYKKRNIYWIVVVCCIFILGTIYLFGNFDKSYSLKKYAELLTGNYETIFSGRLKIYSKALTVIEDTAVWNIQRLILGNGTGYFMSINKGVYTHSIIFDLLIEYGIVGVLLYASLLIYCVVKWSKSSKKENFLFGTYLICLSFPKLLLSSYFQKETYLCLFLIFAIAFCLKEEEKTKM